MRRTAFVVGLCLVATLGWSQDKAKPKKGKGKEAAKAEVVFRLTTEDGRKVILRKDGSWEFAAEEAPGATKPAKPIATPIGTATQKEDEFTKKKVTQITDFKVGEVMMAMFAIEGAPGIEVSARLSFLMFNKEWRYLKCHTLDLLVDGNPVPLPEAKHDGNVKSGFISEHVSVDLSAEVVRKLAGATSIKWRICNDVTEWQAGHAATVYDFAEKGGFFK